MPLVQLVTDLKSLKYGKDTPGGGYSGQPYIQAKIPDGLEPKSPDFILRGGYLTVGDSLTDIKRLTKMFFDLKSPNGLFFIAKQNVLSNSAARTQTSGVLNEGIYTPLNTLAEAGVIAFGGHLNKQGINPFAQTGAYAQGEYLYFNKVKPNPNDPSGSLESNRLVQIYRGINENKDTQLDGFKFNEGGVNVLSYKGGPGAPLGIGNTNIRFADQRTGDNNPLKVSNPVYFLTGSRWVDRTRDSWIFPVTNGASGKYEDYTGKIGSLIFNNNGPVITPDGGYTFNPNFYYNVYNSGSLTPYDPVVNSQKILQSVDINNEQVGGLKVSAVNKPWIKGDQYDLPLNGTSINLNPSASLLNIPSGPLTWTPNVIDINYTSDGRDFSRYLPTLSSPSINNNGVSGKYLRLTGIPGEEFKDVYNSEGTLLKYFNVYDPAVEGNTWPKNTDLIYANNTFTYNQIDLINQPETEGKLTSSPRVQDFRRVLRNKLGGFKNQNGKTSSEVGATPLSPNYLTRKIETRVNLGNPGQRATKDYSDYTAGIAYQGAVKALDKITALPIYRSDFVAENSEAYPVNDLVKFRIAAIDGTAPNFKTFIHFRAFIDSFSDSYTADWTSNKYMGRGEDFYTYNGFGRTISLSFTVAAQSKQELIPMYQKLNYLASNLTPDYSPSGYMRGPLVQLTMGGYLYEQVGFITALTYDVPNDTTWEIGINTSGGSDDNVKELPHRINVSSFNFTPIHNFVPQKQGLTFVNGRGKVTGFDQQRYIALSNGDNTNY
jgi:hypothetical protein